MHHFLNLALLLLGVLAGSAFAADDKTPPKVLSEDRTVLEAGKNVSATFHLFNVTARIPGKEDADDEENEAARKSKIKKVPYTTKGKFHCLITEYNLEPVVLLFVRGNLEDNPAFQSLLQKIDGAIERNPAVRLHSFVVFIADDVESVVKDDDKRDEAAKKIQKLADDLMLKQVVLTLASKSDVAKWNLDPTTALTTVLYKNLRMEAVFATPLDKLDKPDADAVRAILKDVADKLKATR